MPIWPFKSRPPVTPFADPYYGGVLLLASNLDPAQFAIPIPSYLYVIPTSIVLSIVTVAGIRSTNPGRIDFRRGDVTYHVAPAHALASSTSYRLILSTAGVIHSVAPNPLAISYFIPPHLLLYPDDTLVGTFGSALPGDIITSVIIHGRFWEAH